MPLIIIRFSKYSEKYENNRNNINNCGSIRNSRQHDFYNNLSEKAVTTDSNIYLQNIHKHYEYYIINNNDCMY